MSQQTLDQKRAADALSKIRGIQSKSYGLYVSYVSALPATIVANGLGQALAMLLAKDKGRRDSPYWMLYSHIAAWLRKQVPELKSGDDEELLKKLLENNQRVYVRAQAESMAYLNWLKQFARAYLREGQNE